MRGFFLYLNPDFHFLLQNRKMASICLKFAKQVYLVRSGCFPANSSTVLEVTFPPDLFLSNKIDKEVGLAIMGLLTDSF